MVIVRDSKLMEACAKNKLNDTAYKKNKEIYNTSKTKIKNVIRKCYKEHHNLINHEELLKDLADLSNMYFFLNDEKNKDVVPIVVYSKF